MSVYGIFATSSASSGAVPLANLQNAGGASGDIAYWNGSNWVRLAKGSDDDLLTLASGVPAWTAPPAYGGISRVSVVTNWNTDNSYHDINAWTTAGPARNVTNNTAGTLTLTAARDYETHCWFDLRVTGGASSSAAFTGRIMQGGGVLVSVQSKPMLYDGSDADVWRFVMSHQFTASAADVLKIQVRSEVNDVGGTFDIQDGGFWVRSID